MVNVSWNDAAAFAEWLGKNEGKTYRLPTEAEWEYACRAGTTTRYSCGDDPEGLAEVGNVADATAREKHPDRKDTIAARDGFAYTAPIGRYRPNAFGLHDMHGNVWEWCWDAYDKDHYKKDHYKQAERRPDGSGRCRGRGPGVPGRELAHQPARLPVGEPSQEHARQPVQQPGFPPGPSSV